MANSYTERNKYMQEMGRCAGGPGSACAASGNEYGYSYCWWYYDVHTGSCRALV